MRPNIHPFFLTKHRIRSEHLAWWLQCSHVPNQSDWVWFPGLVPDSRFLPVQILEGSGDGSTQVGLLPPTLRGLDWVPGFWLQEIKHKRNNENQRTIFVLWCAVSDHLIFCRINVYHIYVSPKGLGILLEDFPGICNAFVTLFFGPTPFCCVDYLLKSGVSSSQWFHYFFEKMQFDYCGGCT